MFQQDFSHLLRCQICLLQLKDPILLPCHHSFCKSCLEKYISFSKFHCPFCETEFSNSTKVEELQSDVIVQRIIDAFFVKKKIDSSSIFCSKCDEEAEAVSFCQTCKDFLCQFHQKDHQINKWFKNHHLVSRSDSINHLIYAPSHCHFHAKPYEGFCKTCFELCCPSCSLSTHKDSSHVTYPFCEAKEDEEKDTLNFLMKETLKSVDEIKTSIQEVDQMLLKARERSSSLLKASSKFFFDLFQRILPEIQAELTAEIQKNETILQNQKIRAEIHLQLLENELKNAQLSIKSSNIQGIISSKVELFRLLQIISSSFFVPQKTDNINLSCSDYIFNNPDEEFNLADQQMMISSIVNIFNQLFGITFTIPSLVQIENSVKDKPELYQQQKQRKEEEIQRKTNKIEEENGIKARSKQFQEKKKQDMGYIRSILYPDFSESLSRHQPQIEKWIGKKKLQLLYKASRDGFLNSDFHSRCDNKGATISIVTSKEGYIFGGYTPLSWNSHSLGTYVQDTSNQTFVFTLTNPHNIPPTQYLLDQPQYAIFCYSARGPTFGGGHDISVYSQSDQNSSSYTNFPSSYSDTTGKGKTTFTGNYNFSTQELEVFQVSN